MIGKIDVYEGRRNLLRRAMRYCGYLCACLCILALTACSDGGEEPSDTLDAAAIAANNRGVGLMGRFEYEKARKVFAALVGEHPQWLDVQVNLAIATLNRQQEGDEEAALAIVDRVLQEDPSQLRAHYVAGLLRLYLSSPAEALGHFQRVADADPEDAYAAYYLGQCLAQQSDYERALNEYRRALRLDPYLRSAYYGAFQALQRLKRVAEAREIVADYQRLASNPRARLAEFKYTRMGPKGEARVINRARPAPVPAPKGPVFSDVQRLLGAGTLPQRPWPAGRPASITPVDIQGDGRLDLYIAGASPGDGVHNLVLLRQTGETGTNAFTSDLTHPLARVSEVNAALWGDFDNDGRTDVYLCRRGTNQLWRQVAPGRWEDVTESTRTSGGERNTLDGAFFDADHDGDLDLFLVNTDGPNELFNNNLDGTFRPLAAQQGIAGEGRASRGVIPVDIDRDRDVDILVINEEPPHEVYLNDRLWAYRSAPGFERLRTTPALAALASDSDADGLPELYTLQPDGKLVRWRLDAAGSGKPEVLARTGSVDTAWAQLALLDADGDGIFDLFTATPAGWSVTGLSAQGDEPLFKGLLPEGSRLAGATPVLLEPASGSAVVGLDAQGGVSIWQPGSGRHPYLALALSGMEDDAQSMRSNASGIGAQVAVRVGSRWTLTHTFPNHSGPGQGLQPVTVGLGDAERADFIAIDWSDGVFQSELELEAGRMHSITETQRQLSSCPVLFAWDGERYAFVSDLLGVGGLGYAIGPGEYATPRPWENLLLPAALLKSRKGRYRLKVTEPMEEVAYLDAARLLAYDLPPGWQMVLDERLAILGPEPTGKARFYRRELLPSGAVNAYAGRVTEAVTRVDARAVPVGELDRRFIGRLRAEHSLTLSFPEPLDAYPGEPLLVADGWVEYPYSQTSFAAWQAGAEFDPPTLEAQDADGVWHTVWKDFGYPAGMPRRMSLPLRDLPAGTTVLRIRSNLEVYWDRIAVAFAERLPEVRRYVLPLQKARLAKTGFPKRTTSTQHHPHYDYERRSPFWDTRYMAGFYTRLGPVEALVAEVDDAVAIFGPGEEVHLEFVAPEQGPPPGWTRHFVLETNGWTKDMDLYTQNGETVDPLPHTGEPAARRESLHARYNTRYQAGL